VIGAALLFSTGGAGIKAAAFSAPQVSSLRSAFASIALVLWLRGRLTWSLPALAVGVIYAVMLTLFVAATKLTTAANAIFLQSTAPLYVVLLGPLILGERVRRRDFGYMALLGAGIVLCLGPQSASTATAPDPVTGNILAVICSIAWALTLVSLRLLERAGPPGTRPTAGTDASDGAGLTAVVAGNVLAAVGSAAWAIPLPSASLAEWITIAYLGVFQIGVAYILLTSAMRELPALDVSLLLLIEPVLNPLWAWVIRGENPGRWAVAGGLLIVGATILRVIHEARAVVREPARADT
jgi:drug/metabolite transporter, DME family